MLKRMWRKAKRLYLWHWVYRHADEDVCCCGGSVSKGGYGCVATCRSLKEYCVSLAMGER